MATQYQPSLTISFQSMSMLSSEMDTRTVVIGIVLKHKRRVFLRNQQFQVVDFYETNANSYVAFPFCFDSLRLSYFNFRAQVYVRISGLAASICNELSQQIFMYGQRLLLTRQDLNCSVMVVVARVEIEELEVQEMDEEVEVETESVDDGIEVLNLDNSIEDEESNMPRGLSWGEIERLKQERFKSSGAVEEEESLCSICLEEFLPGVNITPLQCSHSFHHSCIATWLKIQGSCPVCRFDITQACS